MAETETFEDLAEPAPAAARPGADGNRLVDMIVCRGVVYRGSARKPGDIIGVPIKAYRNGVPPRAWWLYTRKAADTEEQFLEFRRGLTVEGQLRREPPEYKELDEFPEAATAEALVDGKPAKAEPA